VRSLEQVLFEQFATAVERAVAPLGPGRGSEPLRVRVLTKDRQQLDFRLVEVDLYDAELVGTRFDSSPIRLPLANVQTVFRRRPRVSRLLLIWLPWTAAGAYAGLLLTSRQHWLTPGLDTFVGACCGAVIAGALSWLLRDWPALYRWVSIYGSPAA
jgi:hypothetical protein